MTPLSVNLTIYKGITFTFTVVLRDSLSLIDTFTANASTNVITTASAHSLVIGDPIQFQTEGGILPLPIEIGRTYFVQSIGSSTTFKFSSTYGGLEFDLTDVGSGTNKVYTNRPINLTSWLIWAWVKTKPGGTLAFDLNPLVPTPANGTIDMSKTDEQTILYTPGNYSWDMILQKPTGERIGPLFQGGVSVTELITEPPE